MKIKQTDETFRLLMDLKGVIEDFGEPREDEAFWAELSDNVGALYHKYEGNAYRELFSTVAFCIQDKAKLCKHLD